MSGVVSVRNPFSVFTGLDGKALDSGRVYVGTAGLDPISNPIALFWDEALTITAAQPLITSGGLVYRNGSPAAVYASVGTYSITVQDKKGQFVYSDLEADGSVVGIQNIETDLASTAPGKGDALIGVLKTGGVARTQHEVNNDFFTVEDFVEPGDLDYTAAIQRCMDAQELVYFPMEQDYTTSSPLVQSRRNIFRGVGTGSRIVNSKSDLFWLGTAFGVGYRSVFEDLALVSSVGGGHIFLQKDTVVRYQFNRLFIDQQNDDKSIYSHIENLGNFLGNEWNLGEYYHTYTATVPAFHFVVLDGAGATNVNRWKGMTINRGSKPWFYFESKRVNNYIYDVKLQDILFEVATQGIVVGLGVNGFIVDNCLTFDLNAQSPTHLVSADLFTFGRGTNAANQPSRNVIIRDYKRTDTDTVLGVYVDFRFTNTGGPYSVQGLSFYNCNRTLNANILADLTGAYEITLTACRITLSGTYYFLTNYGFTGAVTETTTVNGFQTTNQDLALAGTVNNYALAVTTSIIRCTLGGAVRNLSGILAPVGAIAASPRMVWIYNAEPTHTLTLLHDTTSTAANRFYCPGAVNYAIPSFGGVLVVYDVTLSRWIVMGN